MKTIQYDNRLEMPINLNNNIFNIKLRVLSVYISFNSINISLTKIILYFIGKVDI